jgi:hypothetical protein
MCIFNRSALSNDSSNKNKTATNRNRLTLSSRAGSLNPFFNPIQSQPPIISPQSSDPSNTQTVSSYKIVALPTTTSKTFTSTVLSADPISTTSTAVPTQVQKIVNDESIKKVLPDHYYYSEQDGDYYDNIDELSIPSSTVKTLNHDSSNSLSQSSSPPFKSFIFSNVESELRFKLPSFTEPRYDQSTLKSFFMNNLPSTITEDISLSSMKKILTTTEKSIARDFEVQRQKILSFIISENQPSSFKAPNSTTATARIGTTRSTNHNNNKPSSPSLVVNTINKNDFNHAFVNMQPTLESTVTSNLTNNLERVQTPKTTKLLSRDRSYKSNPIKLSLSTNLDSFKNVPAKLASDRLSSKETLKKISLNNAKQPVIQSLYLNPIEPTTYTPSKPYHVSTESSTKSQISPSPYNTFGDGNDEIEDAEIEDRENLMIHSRRRPFVNDYLSSTSTLEISPRFSLRSTTLASDIVNKVLTTFKPFVNSTSSKINESTTLKSISQSFTSRGILFKEILNKTLEPQINLKPVVSPYLSLETQRLTNAIRTTTQSLTNPKISRDSTTKSSHPLPTSTYRSYFFITAPPKNISTFLFPETSSTVITTSQSPLMTNKPLILDNVKQIGSTIEHSRGKYRPYLSSSQVLNSIDGDATPTTYSPRHRYYTRTNFLNDIQTSTSTEQPIIRRKIIRLKSALSPPLENKLEGHSPTERIDITTYTPSKRIFIDNNFIPSPTRNTSDFRPIITKLNEFIRKLSHTTYFFSTTTQLPKNVSTHSSYNNLTSDNVESSSASVVELTEKPYVTRYKADNINKNNNNLRNVTEKHETSTKKFRATVEMPEINNSFDGDEDELSTYDEEEIEKLPFDDYIDEHTHSSTYSPLHSTYSTIAKSSDNVTKDVTLTVTALPLNISIVTLGPTEKNNNLVLSTLTTINPKSLIPPRATRVNNQLKSSIIASGLPRRNSNSASIKCNDVSSNAKCNEIPSRYKEKLFLNKFTSKEKKLVI